MKILQVGSDPAEPRLPMHGASTSRFRDNATLPDAEAAVATILFRFRTRRPKMPRGSLKLTPTERGFHPRENENGRAWPALYARHGFPLRPRISARSRTPRSQKLAEGTRLG